MSDISSAISSLPAALQDKVNAVRAQLSEAVLRHGSITLANSLGAEDMVLTDIVAREFPGIKIFMLDTGRLHQETYALLQKVEERYGKVVEVYYPQAEAVQDYVRSNGINGFYDSVEQRKSCCFVRKVEPLRRALAGHSAWITGLRRQQSVTRTELALEEWDAGNGLYKLSPLADWSEKDVWSYIRTLGIPYNELHDRFFPSIGCAPCTRAITVGEDVRAGRWWWEQPEAKECGLHARTPAAASSPLPSPARSAA